MIGEEYETDKNFTFSLIKCFFGGLFQNNNGHLPSVPGWIWFEADLNYYNGRRNRYRVLWSNDGLMFVTYDHYDTFIEVIGG